MRMYGCCLQANKHNKTADRAVLFTDKFIYKLDPKKRFKPMKPGIPITDVSFRNFVFLAA